MPKLRLYGPRTKLRSKARSGGYARENSARQRCKGESIFRNAGLVGDGLLRFWRVGGGWGDVAGRLDRSPRYGSYDGGYLQVPLVKPFYTMNAVPPDELFIVSGRHYCLNRLLELNLTAIPVSFFSKET